MYAYRITQYIFLIGLSSDTHKLKIHTAHTLKMLNEVSVLLANH